MDTTTRAGSPLRQRTIEDMRMRKLEPRTRQGYIRAVRKLTEFLKRSPDTASVVDLRNFQLHLVDSGTSRVRLNATLTGLKVFFDITLGRGELMARMQPVKLLRTVPVVLNHPVPHGGAGRPCAALRGLRHRPGLLQLLPQPAPIADIAYTNKAAIYGLLFDVAAEVLQTIAADPRHLGARIGATLVLHTWGSALTHHPHVHGIVPGGGLSADGQRWIACRPGFFLPLRALSRLFRRRFLEALQQLQAAGKLQCFGEHVELAQTDAFRYWLAPMRRCEWVIYAKLPFAGPEAVLAYLPRYTHRAAISNSRLLALDERGVTFRWKDYRAKGRTRYKAMTLTPHAFMRRFLLHVLPGGVHRIRHYGLLANASRRDNLATVR